MWLKQHKKVRLNSLEKYVDDFNFVPPGLAVYMPY